ncbi:hypothetical protein [Kineosporia sp. A_224]|uniref:hypothetical protein n=1 Tax=Kineosporia sp. A_224 TaxID=1962180 RepID=UPI000B4ABF97|nr:hypothetical protein [Kineosporia sp. A_224]
MKSPQRLVAIFILAVSLSTVGPVQGAAANTHELPFGATAPASLAAAAASPCPTLIAGKPYKSGSYAKSTWSYCNPSDNYYVTATLQDLRWFGWESLDSETQYAAKGTYHSGLLSASCSGFGTRTYRTTVEVWYAAVGTVMEKTSTQVRWSC